VLHLASNAGKAEAVWRGFERAFAAETEIVGYFDADLATPLSELPGMVAEMAHPDVYAVLGSRVGLLGRRIQRSLPRHYVGRLFATAASWVLGISVYDTQCGAKLFRCRPEIREIFSRRFSVRWTFDVEILARCRQAALTGTLAPVEVGIIEHPLRCWRDVAGSKLRALDGVRAVVELARIWRTYRGRGHTNRQ
jgi:hypothetical protein